MKTNIFKKKRSEANKTPEQNNESVVAANKNNIPWRIVLPACAVFLIIVAACVVFIPMLAGKNPASSNTTGQTTAPDITEDKSSDIYTSDDSGNFDPLLSSLSYKTLSEGKIKITKLDLMYKCDETLKIDNLISYSYDTCMLITLKNSSDNVYRFTGCSLYGGFINTSNSDSEIFSNSSNNHMEILPGMSQSYIIPLTSGKLTGEDFTYDIMYSFDASPAHNNILRGNFTANLLFYDSGNKENAFYSEFYGFSTDTTFNKLALYPPNCWYSESFNESLQLSEDGSFIYKRDYLSKDPCYTFSGTYTMNEDHTILTLDGTDTEGIKIHTEFNCEISLGRMQLYTKLYNPLASNWFVYNGNFDDSPTEEKIRVGDSFDRVNELLGKPFYSNIYEADTTSSYDNYYFVNGKVLQIYGLSKVESINIFNDILAGVEYDSCEVVGGTGILIEFKITKDDKINYYIATWKDRYKELSFIGMNDYKFTLEDGCVKYTKPDGSQATIFFCYDHKIIETEPIFGIYNYVTIPHYSHYGNYRVALRVISEGKVNYIELFDVFNPFFYYQRIPLSEGQSDIRSIEYEQEIVNDEGGDSYPSAKPSKINVTFGDGHTETYNTELKSEQVYVSDIETVKHDGEYCFEFTIINNSADDYFTSLYHIGKADIYVGWWYDANKASLSNEWSENAGKYVVGCDTINGIESNHDMDIRIGSGEQVKIYLPISTIEGLTEEEFSSRLRVYMFNIPLIKYDRTKAVTSYIGIEIKQ